jgi:hypothetical protein
MMLELRLWSRKEAGTGRDWDGKGKRPGSLSYAVYPEPGI